MIASNYNNLERRILTAAADSAARTSREVALAAFIITGNSDDASAKLKATLEASDTRFNADLEALFKSKSKSPPPPPSTPRTPAAPAAGGHASAGWTLDTNRNRSSNPNNAGSLRGRPRVTPSR